MDVAEQAHARREDRSLEHRMACAVEADELALAAATDNARLNAGPLAVVDRLYAHLAPRAGVLEHRTLDARRGTGRRMRIAERRLTEQQDVVGHVHDSRSGGAEVAQRPGSPIGLDYDPLLAPLDAHRATVDAAVGVDGRHHGLDDG
jgi:hypothetical protein